MKKLIAYYTEAKSYSKQIVQASFDDILCRTFRIPSQEEMEKSLEGFIENSFDEHQVRAKIKAKHPGWDKERVNGEVYKRKMKLDNQYRKNLRKAASEAITDIEYLIISLNDTIKAWKIKNLE